MAKTPRKQALKNTSEEALAKLARSAIGYYLGKTHEGNRDLYKQFGYPTQVQPEQLYGMYQRNDIANRIISAYPKATWREMPVIRDEQGETAEKGEGYSQFCDSIGDLFERLKVVRTLERADRLSTVGNYGVLFLGFDDKKEPRLALEGKAKLLFMSPYSQVNAKVAQWDTNINSPRYGLPILYNLTSANLDASTDKGPMRSITAHYSRIIHLAENMDQDDTHGTPRLLPLYNRLLDLEKVVGGSAETFWLTAKQVVAYWADKDTNLDAEAIQKIKDQADEFEHGLRRSFVGQGMSAQVISANSPDPEPNAAVLIDLISGAAGIPKRILLGTERGELSSAQDENNWSDRIHERRINHATPNILRPFVAKMIETGNVTEPQGQWWIEWPDKGALGPVAESDILVKRTTALTSYANSPDAQFIVPMQEFRRDFLGMDPESEYEIEEPEELDETEEVGVEPEEPEADDAEEFVDANNAAIANMAPKPLYVSRNVRNVEAFRKWAKEQGLDQYEATDPLHVTVCYSKEPVDWLAVSQTFGEDDDGSFLVHPGGPRVLEQFGDCIVLSFVSDGLSWRHRELKQAGATHSYPKYQPHVTICKVPEGVKLDLSELKPYVGAIALGPEIFEDIKD